jgi:hypothetical protein
MPVGRFAIGRDGRLHDCDHATEDCGELDTTTVIGYDTLDEVQAASQHLKFKLCDGCQGSTDLAGYWRDHVGSDWE